MEQSKIWLYSKKQMRFLLTILFLFFGILYQYPVLGIFNETPGRILWYVLILNTLYIIITGWVVFGWLYKVHSELD